MQYRTVNKMARWNLDLTKSSVQHTVFFAPVIVNYMENLKLYNQTSLQQTYFAQGGTRSIHERGVRSIFLWLKMNTLYIFWVKRSDTYFFGLKVCLIEYISIEAFKSCIFFLGGGGGGGGRNF